jgi:DNA-binding NarL/FixJ family response regulator
MTVETADQLEIGEKLLVSRAPWKPCRQNLMKKLDIKNQLELIRFALKQQDRVDG